MKLSLEWLSEHVQVSVSAKELAERLTAAGMAVDTMEKIGDDHVLELELAANRPDCLSVRGLAREVGALFRTRLSDLSALTQLAETGAPASTSFALQNDIPELCCRFTARVVRGVKVGPSPAWLATRLERAGLRPINNLVDITNYVMLELGHPLHAFDLATLRGGRLEVRLAEDGERLMTLDGTERKLGAGMIVIADGERLVSLAGIMGGQDTEISSGSSDVLLEAAWWDPVTIYRTGRALGLSSDAAYRFERGADREATVMAVDRAARLVADVAGGEVAAGRVDDSPVPLPERQVTLRLARLNMLLGTTVEKDEAGGVLESLGFAVEPAAGALRVTVPSHRSDVSREEDLIEEVGRIVGYDRVPETLPTFPSTEQGRSEVRTSEREVRRLVEDAGFLEALNYTFVARGDDARFSAWPEDVVALSNPMSERGDVLRSALLPSLVRNAVHNTSHGADRLRLYEIGRVFRSLKGSELPEERLHLAMIAVGDAAPSHWSRPPTPVDLFDVKGSLESLVERLRLPPLSPRPGGPAHLEPSSALTLTLQGQEVAWMGYLAPDANGAMALEPRAVVAEMYLGTLLAQAAPPVRYRPIPRYPSVIRDLSLVMPWSRGYAEIEEIVLANGGEMVKTIVPFDRYSGPGLPAGTIGLSVRISFQHPARTLVSEEVDAVQQQIVDALKQDLGARLRE